MANTPQSVIAKLQNTPGKLDKIAIITKEATAGNAELFEGFRYAFDALITFGVASIPLYSGSPACTINLPWATFKSALEDLRTRRITGNAARDLIVDLMIRSNQDQWNNWYRRVLLKDMKAKFTESTVNKAVKKIDKSLMIPVFECQLATSIEDHPEKLTGKLRIESKLDGVRILTVVFPTGEYHQYSRNGIEKFNFKHTAEQLRDAAIKHFKVPMVFDGEIMSSSFQDLMTQINRKTNKPAKDAVLNLFDMLPLSEFTAGLSQLGQQDRSDELEKFYSKHSNQMPSIAILGYEIVDVDTTAGLKRFEEINRAALDAGFEGIMLKNLAAKYKTKRGFNWMKRKPVITVDLTIVDTEQGKDDKKFANTLGALVCEGKDHGKHIKVNVSNVGDEKQRDDFWKRRKQLIGQVVEIAADAVTQSKESKAVWSLRFPRFVRFRDDK